ncbi:hypothetical protein CPT_Stills1 [Bacillus phage Stills]|uniref:Uncharacterized protein n=1 Tax=Bacillus phage Stills TaxID=1610833 RepID=A0A0E3T690_9CAUD|nr:hypothetical protein CPT_Stills1 [Bacillus phage Stills]AKC02629.1 hypothetical protein CPT_Stills1 [Bacillus phage Stills]
MMEKYYVIKVINTEYAPIRHWYRRKEGELFIVRKIHDQERYITNGFINEDCAQGEIDDFYCQIITEFEMKDEY